MNKSLALVSGLVVMSLTGCSSQLDNQTASGSYDYLKAQQNKPIDTPASLDKPEFARDHEIPELGDGADSTLVGRKVPVTSPALVHPLVVNQVAFVYKPLATILAFVGPFLLGPVLS